MLLIKWDESMSVEYAIFVLLYIIVAVFDKQHGYVVTFARTSSSANSSPLMMLQNLQYIYTH